MGHIEPIKDAAWFYSSMAQSCAAIVGLLGAVLVTRITDHIAWLRSERDKIQKCLEDTYTGLQRRQVGQFQWYLDFLNEEIPLCEQALANGQTTHQTTKFVTWTGGGSNSGGITVDARVRLEEAKNALPLVKRAIIVYRNIDDMELTGADYLLHQLRDLRDQVPDPPRAHIDEDIKAIRETMFAVARFKDRAPPRSFVVVFLILAFLAFTGIVWPLAALPGFSGAYSKGAMLTMFALGIVCLVGFFGFQLVEMWLLGRFVWPRPRGS